MARTRRAARPRLDPSPASRVCRWLISRLPSVPVPTPRRVTRQPAERPAGRGVLIAGPAGRRRLLAGFPDVIEGEALGHARVHRSSSRRGLGGHALPSLAVRPEAPHRTKALSWLLAAALGCGGGG